MFPVFIQRLSRPQQTLLAIVNSDFFYAWIYIFTDLFVFSHRPISSRHSPLVTATYQTHYVKINIFFNFSVSANVRQPRHAWLTIATCKNRTGGQYFHSVFYVQSVLPRAPTHRLGFSVFNQRPRNPRHFLLAIANLNSLRQNQYVHRVFCFQPASQRLSTLVIGHNNMFNSLW